MRSTGSSNCSQPCSSTRLVRGLSDSAKTFSTRAAWFLRQGQADDVDVVLLDRPHHRRAPAAADVEQRHPGLQAQLAQRQVDLGELRLFQRHVVALEVRAAVGPRRVQEQPRRSRRTGRSAPGRPRSAVSDSSCRLSDMSMCLSGYGRRSPERRGGEAAPGTRHGSTPDASRLRMLADFAVSTESGQVR